MLAPIPVQFLAEHPHLLSREGSQQLRSKLLLLQGWRLPPPLCPLVLARCPPLLKQPEESLQVGGGQGRGCSTCACTSYQSGVPRACCQPAAASAAAPPSPRAVPWPPRVAQEAADILMNYGMTSQQLHQVLLAYPYVLCLQ